MEVSAVSWATLSTCPTVTAVPPLATVPSVGSEETVTVSPEAGLSGSLRDPDRRRRRVLRHRQRRRGRHRRRRVRGNGDLRAVTAIILGHESEAAIILAVELELNRAVVAGNRQHVGQGVE